MLVELHSLTSHAPANLNRDDLGRPKAAVFGGTQRARVSSQAIKRSIRTSNYLGEMLGDRLSTRSRRIPEKIFNELKVEIGDDASSEEKLRALCEMFTTLIAKPDKAPLHTKQIVFLTHDEIERAKAFIRETLASGGKLGKKEIEEIKTKAIEHIGLDRRPADAVDMALFGRMTTDDANAFAEVDAAMQVAHAISTHTVVPDVDWFTAVDDIVTGGAESGSGHLGETEFNSAVFYKYFSCNLPLLINNLGGDRGSAIESLAAVLDAACRVTPSGKQNSFASHALADTVLLVLRGSRTPVSLANAFEQPIPESEEGFLKRSRERMAREYAELKKGYELDDITICFAVSSEERARLAEILPEGTQMVGSLGELFAAMKQHLAGMLPASPTANGKAAMETTA
jgi:CRISPR system Cascade subunit CasC